MTLDDIRARCVEVGECWLWRGRLSGGGGPKIRNRSARRLVLELHTGKRAPRHLLAVTACREPGCLNPQHLRLTTKAGLGALAAREGAFNSPQRIAAVVRGARSRAKLTVEIAREIRLSDESLNTLAARYGVRRETIRAARRGITWREAANGASVFNWRPAA